MWLPLSVRAHIRGTRFPIPVLYWCRPSWAVVCHNVRLGFTRHSQQQADEFSPTKGERREIVLELETGARLCATVPIVIALAVEKEDVQLEMIVSDERQFERIIRTTKAMNEWNVGDGKGIDQFIAKIFRPHTNVHVTTVGDKVTLPIVTE